MSWCRVLAVACAAAALLGLVACGGKTHGATPSAGAGGAVAAGGDAGLDGGGEEPPPKPDTVSLLVDGHEPLVGGHVVATCLPSFEGFKANIDGYAIEFEAFVHEPGDYSGDPVQVLSLSVRSPDGREYCAVGGLATCLPGVVTLRARAVAPRFTGYIEALAFDRNDSAAPPLKLTLDFDVADSACL